MSHHYCCYYFEITERNKNIISKENLYHAFCYRLCNKSNDDEISKKLRYNHYESVKEHSCRDIILLNI